MVRNDNLNKPIVIFGGTGYYGRHIVKSLIDKCELVRVFTRNERKAALILGNKVEIIEGDVTNHADIVKSLQNAKAAIISLSAFHPKLIRKIRKIEKDAVFNIISECKKKQISRIIYLSGYDMRPDILKKLKIEKFGAIKIEVENRIKQSYLNWTILGCSPSFELFFAFLRNKNMTIPGGGLKPITCISAIDVGEVTAQSVLREDLKGMRIKLTGPEAISFPEAAKYISMITGKKIKYKKIPLIIIKVVACITLPFNPFVRYIYWSLKLLNNFPEDISENVELDHQRLISIFDYKFTSFKSEIKRRMLTK